MAAAACQNRPNTYASAFRLVSRARTPGREGGRWDRCPAEPVVEKTAWGQRAALVASQSERVEMLPFPSAVVQGMRVTEPSVLRHSQCVLYGIAPDWVDMHRTRSARHRDSRLRRFITSAAQRS